MLTKLEVALIEKVKELRQECQTLLDSANAIENTRRFDEQIAREDRRSFERALAKMYKGFKTVSEVDLLSHALADIVAERDKSNSQARREILQERAEEVSARIIELTNHE